MEECPSGHARMQEHLELRDLVNTALKGTNSLARSVENLDKKFKERSDLGNVCFEQQFVFQMFDKWDRPEVVANVCTGKVHATAGNNFRANPCDWTTACGWKWVVAGRDAKACIDAGDLPAEISCCNKCKDKLPGWAVESVLELIKGMLILPF